MRVLVREATLHRYERNLGQPTDARAFATVEYASPPVRDPLDSPAFAAKDQERRPCPDCHAD
jgi:hypothetical protein